MTERSPDALYAERALRHLADTLRQRRQTLGLTQAAAGARAGISGKTVASLEAHSRALRLEKLLEYAHALGVAAPYLFPDDPELPLTRLVHALNSLSPEWTDVLLDWVALATRRTQQRPPPSPSPPSTP